MSEMSEQVVEFVKAGFSGIWVHTNEQEDAMSDLIAAANANEWSLGFWDIGEGLRGTERIAAQKPQEEDRWHDRNVSQMLRELPTIAATTGHKKTLLVLKNFHRRELIDNTSHIQLLQSSLQAGKAEEHGWCIVILAPKINVPMELDPDFVVVTHELPDKDQLWAVAESVAEEGELPEDEGDKKLLLQSAAGLTRREAENAYSLSIVKKEPFDPAIVWGIKAQTLKKRELLTLYEGDESFETLGGYDNFKNFTSRLLSQDVTDDRLRPKGVLLLGVPGAGKSASVHALGNHTGRRVLELDMGSLRSKFQGETDENLAAALSTADAMEPCILFVDEIEKALSGTSSSGSTDGGTGSRVFGKLLRWLNDHTSDVFFIGTCNDISQLPPEFSRAERFDGLFFFDLPTDEERKVIWDIYFKMFDIDPGKTNYIKLSNGWTGAEIRTCCRLSKIMDQSLEEAAILFPKISVNASDQLKDLRDWADTRCLSASHTGLFTSRERKSGAIGTTKKRRKVRRDTTFN